MGLMGIDVSNYNGIIDWQKVKKAGVNFAIIKIVKKDLTVDSRFESNWRGCKDNGIEIKGVYNYSYATTVAKAKTDAKRVLEILKGRKTTVWLDVEDDCQMHLKKGELVKIINAYAQVITDGGCSFGVYTGETEYNNLMKPNGMPKYPMWIARYGKDNGKRDIKYQPQIDTMVGWQYTSKGKIDGIKGNVDLNYWYKEVEAIRPKYVNPYTEPKRLLFNKTPMQRGDDVKWVQAWLVQKGFLAKTNSKGETNIDGIFGQITDDAVRKFQKKVNITVDGKVGSVTRDYLKI